MIPSLLLKMWLPATSLSSLASTITPTKPLPVTELRSIRLWCEPSNRPIPAESPAMGPDTRFPAMRTRSELKTDMPAQV